MVFASPTYNPLVKEEAPSWVRAGGAAGGAGFGEW